MAATEGTLAEYEELFSNRYSENDEEYQKYIAAPQIRPPVVTDWLSATYNDR